jgi:hypothetical protein
MSKQGEEIIIMILALICIVLVMLGDAFVNGL